MNPVAAVSARFFDRIYELNSSRLVMPVNKRYPIDQVAVDEWVIGLQTNGAPELVVRFAQTFQQNARHISFEEFYHELYKCAVRLRNSCAKTNKRIVMLIPEDTSTPVMRKSGFWVGLLIWPIVRPFVVEVVQGFQDVDMSLVESGNTVFLYADDASFTGNQASDLARLDAYEKSGKEVEFCMVIPFMTEQAREEIRTYWGDEIQFYSSSTDLLPLSAFFSREEVFEVALYPGFAQLKPEQCMVYFDHKMPDSVSTTDFLFLFGPVYLGSRRFKTRPFVSGCDASSLRLYPSHGTGKQSVEQELAHYLSYRVSPLTIEARGGVVCPARFYGGILYEWPA